MENKPIQQRRNETIMPGYILHLTAAQMFLKTQKGQKFLKTKQDKNRKRKDWVYDCLGGENIC